MSFALQIYRGRLSEMAGCDWAALLGRLRVGPRLVGTNGLAYFGKSLCY
jgi:hypothetical protein